MATAQGRRPTDQLHRPCPAPPPMGVEACGRLSGGLPPLLTARWLGYCSWGLHRRRVCKLPPQG